MKIGDVNIDLLHVTPNFVSLQNFLESHDFYQLIDEPTRITNTSQTLNDQLITSDKEEVSNIAVDQVDNIL